MSTEVTNHFSDVLDRIWGHTKSLDNPLIRNYHQNTLTLPLEKLISDQTPSKPALLACKAWIEFKIFEINFVQFVYDHPALSAAIVTAATTTFVVATTVASAQTSFLVFGMMGFFAILAIRYGGFKFVKENEALKALLEDLSKQISEWDPQNPEAIKSH